jgi:hypothetical protein
MKMDIKLNNFPMVKLWEYFDNVWWFVDCYDTPAGLQIAGEPHMAYQ